MRLPSSKLQLTARVYYSERKGLLGVRPPPELAGRTGASGSRRLRDEVSRHWLGAARQCAAPRSAQTA